MRALRYAFGEAVSSLWRGRHSGVFSVATIALALSVLGGFLLVTANLQRLSAEWSNAAEMSVYLADDVTSDQRKEIEARLAPSGVVQSREYVSKGDALIRFKQTFSDLAGTVDTVGENPLPASYEVRLRGGAGGAGSQAALDSLGARLRELPGVVDVRYDREWLNRLLSAVAVMRGIGFALGAILTVAAALTVANVVRLALYARRDELEIMHLVGAPSAYVRGPFIMEGLLQGGIGAVAALLILTAAFFALRARYLVPLASAVSLSSVHFLTAGVCVSLVIGGMAVGCLGGLVAAWSGR
jgi:cell division transport system permease protein